MGPRRRGRNPVAGFAGQTATTDPIFGFKVAVRGTVAAVGLLCGGAGVACLLIARWSPAVRYAGERMAEA